MPGWRADVTQDGFLGGRLTVFQPRNGYRAAVDPVLLAASADAHAGQSVLELGCGSGTALLCLCWRVSGIDATGLEIQPHYAQLARQNALANGFDIKIWEGSVADPPRGLRQLSFDCVIANPPYRKAGEGPPPSDSGRRLAETETAPLSDWTDFAARRLRPGGSLTAIFPPSRLQGFLACLPETLGGIEIKPIRARSGRDAGRLVIRARKGSGSGLRMAPDLILHSGGKEKYSRAAEDVLRGGAPLEF